MGRAAFSGNEYRKNRMTEIHVCRDSEALACYARDWLVALITKHQADATNRPFTMALSGGSTPKRLYQLLSEVPQGTVDWRRVVLIWGDERNVAADHADSNFRMVSEALLQRVDIPPENVLSVPSPGGPANEAASSYETMLKQYFGSDAISAIDCVLLGMGDDVHTASLFPETKALEEQNRWVIENWVEKLDCWRITLTAPVINSARNVVFLIAGTGKQSALKTLWHGERKPELYPSQLIQPAHGNLYFMLDRSALGENALLAQATFKEIDV